MFSFLCNFYGGMPADWLKTPVRTFFAMYREGNKLQARQFSELARIQLISNNMKIEYYLEVQERYRGVYDPEHKKVPERAGGPVLDAGSNNAMRSMKNVAKAMKQNLGYGRR